MRGVPDDHVDEPQRRVFLAALGVAGGAALTGFDLLAPRPSHAASGAWGGYANGGIPSHALRSIPWRADLSLRPDAVATLSSLNESFVRAFARNLPLRDAYRTYAGQVVARNNACAGGNCGFAAEPGTSNHGWALAVDIDVNRTDWSNPIYVWMKHNAGRFGWIHPAWAEPSGFAPEAWHWEYAGAYSSSEEDDLTPEQDNRLKNIENLLAVPGAGYGWAQVAANNASNVQSRLAVPNAGYDYLPAIVNQMNALTDKINALQAKIDAL